MSKRKRILLVGGFGYIGNALIGPLVRAGYEITIFDSLALGQKPRDNLLFLQGDVRNQRLLKNFARRFDSVVWLAQFPERDQEFINFEESYLVNEKCLESFAGSYQGKIIFLSTYSVYGFMDEEKGESAGLLPSSDFASSKMRAEWGIIKNSKDFLILRPGIPYGQTKDQATYPKNNLINFLINESCTDQNLKSGESKFPIPLIHVDDLASGITFCLKSDQGGVYNIASQNLFLTEILHEIAPHSQPSMKRPSLKGKGFLSSESLRLQGWKPSLRLSDEIARIANQQ